MTGENTYLLFSNHDLLKALDDISRALSRKRYIQKELLACAWICIAESDANKTIEYYTALGYAVMRNKYEIYHMPIPKTWPSQDAGIQRVRKKIRKFYVKR